MAEVTKYQLISNTTNNHSNNIISELKAHFSIFKTRKSSSFIYGVVLVFVCFTLLLAFSPSSPSPWFTNDSSSSSSSRSHFDSVYSYFFPNSSSQIPQINSSRSHHDASFPPPLLNHSLPISQNLNETQTQTQIPPDKVEQSKNSTDSEKNPVNQSNQSSVFVPQSAPVSQNDTIAQGSNSAASAPQSAPVSQSNVASAPQSSQLGENTTIVHETGVSSVSDQINSPTNHTSERQQNATIISPEQQQTSPTNSTTQPQLSPAPSNSTKKGSGIEVNSSEIAASLSKNNDRGNANDSVSTEQVKKKQQQQQGNNEVEGLVGCDLYDGGWVRDDSYPLYKPGSCKIIDEQFNCIINGRPDRDFQKLKWKPNGCSLPRLNGEHMLKLLRGKRLVFVGDSLNRNMWESLVCILRNSVKNKKHVYEAFGRYSFRTEASYSFVFKDYNCTVEFFVSPFLVQQFEVKQKDGSIKETLRLDLMVQDANEFKNADFLVFNTGHWWTHDKTSKGEDYYQEGSHVYKQLDVNEAFRRAITTWARWVDANVDLQKTHVMFRGYSASHFSGGQWNSGGKCDGETEPIKNDTYLTQYPSKMELFESVIKGMKLPVSYLNITRLTDYRKDGHPSVYRKQHVEGDEKARPLKYQDCSHWCLPGVPDSWNELLYAELLRKQFTDQQQKNKT